MRDFVFQSPTKIIFGRDTENQAGTEAKKYGTRVLLHYGGGSIKKSGLYDRVISSLKKEGMEIFELGGVKPNPRLGTIYEGIKLCREKKVDVILAVGGGSVIDSAKAIAVGVPYEGDVWDFFLRKAIPEKSIPLGVVLTIPATGSEASNSCVITNENGWFKKGFNHDINRPCFSILNPELSFTLPPFQTACGACDIMSHVLERYFTNEQHVDLTDRMCEATLRTVIKYAPIALNEPENYDVRAELMWAGTIAHNGLLGTGRVEDWASHRIEHELSGIYDVTHGAGLAVIFPAWMKYVYKHNINRFVQYASRVWDVDPDYNDPEWTALEGIRRTENFFKEIGLPTTLRGLGISDDRFDEMASKSMAFGPLGGFVKLEKQDVINIYNIAK